MPSLLSLPTEVLSNIAFSLVALSPLGPPSILIPFLLTAPSINAVLNQNANHALYASIAALKFDCSPVARRAFRPTAKDATSHLIDCCRVLRVIRAADVTSQDAPDALLSSFVLLLENDGRNRAQLEWAGVYNFADRYVRQLLYTTSPSFDGWPEDESYNASALWVLWLMTTPESLRAESQAQSEHMVRLLFPFVFNPFRYTSTEAPPNHFNLPLHANHPIANAAITIPTLHGNYPIYPEPERATNYAHFGSRPRFCVPPAANAAKLLFFARRELLVLAIPPSLPATRADARARGITGVMPTQEDIREVNSHKGAQPVDRVVWDWDLGVARRGPDGNSTVVKGDSASIKWDCSWWRQRTCHDLWRRQPRWRPGQLYVPGSMSGLWQGRILIPFEGALAQVINNAAFPQGGLDLNFAMQPLFMRLQEHHCLFPEIGEQNASTVNNHLRPTRPIPEPNAVQLDGGHEIDLSSQNAWLPGRIGGVNWTRVAPSERQAEEVRRRGGNVRIPSDMRMRELVRITLDYDTLNNPTTPVYIYETYSPTQRSMHAPERCTHCFAREQVLARIRGEEAEVVERLFAAIGLGSDISRETQGSDVEMDESSSDVDSLMDEDSDDDEGQELEFEGDDMPDGEPEIITPTGEYVESTRRVHDRSHIEPCEGVMDIVLTGRTDDRHSFAWNKYEFYGRVRRWDGLIAILRKTTFPAVQYNLLYGYLVGKDTFVGNWRMASADPLAPGWESAFVMSRREE